MIGFTRKSALAIVIGCILIAAIGTARAAGAFAVGACGAYGYGYDYRKPPDARAVPLAAIRMQPIAMASADLRVKPIMEALPKGWREASGQEFPVGEFGKFRDGLNSASPPNSSPDNRRGLGVGMTGGVQPLKCRVQADSIWTNDQLGRAAPAQMDNVDAAIVGPNFVRARIGLVPFDHHDGVPGPPLTVIFLRSK